MSEQKEVIDLKKAYEIVSARVKSSYGVASEEDKLKITGCIDIGDRWTFSFEYDGQSIKGAPLLTVEKSTGKLGSLHLPREDNFKLLKDGTEINISAFTI